MKMLKENKDIETWLNKAKNKKWFYERYMKITFQKKKVFTKGNINVLDIKIGDVQYEFEYGHGIKSTVISFPTKSEDGTWSWSNKLSSGSIINYSVNENYQHYGPNLYDCIAYEVKNWLG